jgi:hypothetical protein
MDHKHSNQEVHSPPREFLLIRRHWRLAEIYNGYTKKRTKIPETISRSTFFFESDGSFKQSENDVRSYEGRWALSDNQKELTLQYRLGRNDSSTFRIRELTDEKLNIVRAGRCGAIIETYRPTAE